MSDGCMARTHRAPRRAQIFRGNISRAGKPIWNGKIESGRKLAAAMLAIGLGHRDRNRRLRLEVRRHNGPCLAAGLNVPLSSQQGISCFDSASCQTQFLGQRTCRGNAVTRLQQSAGNGAAKPIVDLAIKRFGRRWIQRRDLAGLCDGHGLAPTLQVQLDNLVTPISPASGASACNTINHGPVAISNSWTLGIGHEVSR